MWQNVNDRKYVLKFRRNLRDYTTSRFYNLETDNWLLITLNVQGKSS